MNCEEKILHLQNTPKSWLRHELLIRLKIALSNLPENQRRTLIIQLIEIRIQRKCYVELIAMWPNLESNFPQISSILSDYDLTHLHHQAFIATALEQAIKSVI